jgi:hypothetical protein
MRYIVYDDWSAILSVKSGIFCKKDGVTSD